MRAHVIVLAGPSGAGKTRLAQRLGLPVLRLDDFYASAGDPRLPLVAHGPRRGTVDWDPPDSWLLDDAVEALEGLCRDGRAEVPIYDLAHDGRCGSRVVDLGDAAWVVAEGLFAAEVLPACRERGLLGAAYCVRRHPVITAWRRLVRDLRERRKPVLLLIERGVTLLRTDRMVIARALDAGCEPVTDEEGYERVRALVEAVGSAP